MQHVDITNRERVSAGKDQKITASSWDPYKGAREAQQRVEAAIKAEWEREQEIVANDPVQQRLKSLEDKLSETTKVLNKAVKRIEGLEARDA